MNNKLDIKNKINYYYIFNTFLLLVNYYCIKVIYWLIFIKLTLKYSYY